MCYLHRCSLSVVRCFTGLRSLCLTIPPGLVGGAYVDTPVKEGWLYIVKARVFHEAVPPHEVGEETRLTLWDMRDLKEASPPAEMSGEWEV